MGLHAGQGSDKESLRECSKTFKTNRLPVLAGDKSVGYDMDDRPDSPASFEHFPPRILDCPQNYFW